MIFYWIKILNNVAPIQAPNDGALTCTPAFGFFIVENKSGGLYP